MIQLPARASVFVAHESVSFRNGIDGLMKIVMQTLGLKPFDGSFYVFRSRSHRQVRLLYYDGSGFWLATKRLSKGSFRYWPDCGEEKKLHSSVLVRELQILIWGGDPGSAKFPKLWKKLE